jgi:peptidoglycan hydrolase-like protein with peptidoglycan-binding domain
MRNRSPFALALALVVVALSVAACGGGLEATTTDEFFETGGFTETAIVEPPPVEPTPPAETETIVLEVAAGQPIGPQSPAEQVAELQRALLALGYKVGKADGVYGSKTRKAVVKFQKAHKLKADGLVGQKTARVMNQELAKLG